MPWVPDPTSTAAVLADLDAARGHVAQARVLVDTAQAAIAPLPAETRWRSPAMAAFESELGAWMQEVTRREEEIASLDQQLFAARIRLQAGGG